MLCETKSRVVPAARMSRRRWKHFCVKNTSPTASASSTMRRSGSTLMDTANASRSTMPLEYVLTG